MASDRDPSRPYGLFHSYADDTPLDGPPDHEEARPLAAGWSDRPAWAPEAPPPADLPGDRPLWRRPLVAGSAAAALIAIGAGWFVLREPQSVTPPQPAAQTAATQPLEVVVVAPPPTPIPKAAERLEVLPPGGVAPARMPPPPLAIAPSQPVDVTPPSPRTSSPPPPALAEAEPSVRPSAQTTASASQVARDANADDRPSQARFDACRDAPTRAYEMVCSDRRLAEADRRMKRAYSAALAAGAPPDALRRDQEDWLDVREEAAQISPRAVADIYRQRTRELFAIADGRWE